LEFKLTRTQSLPISVAQVSISFINDREMRKLNTVYRGKDKTTDVLSFSQIEGATLIDPPSLGDVVISLDTAERQAHEYKVSLARETLRLLVHGLLHLCGFDHERVSARRMRQMQKMEDYLFALHAPEADRWRLE